MNYSEIKEAASKINFSNLNSRTTESEVCQMILDGRMTEEKFNMQINKNRLERLVDFVSKPAYKPVRTMHRFKTLDNLNAFVSQGNCGAHWFDNNSGEYCVYYYK